MSLNPNTINQFCYIKVGFKGSKLYRYVFVMVFGMCTVCLSFFAYPLGAIGRMCCMFLALPGHRLCYVFTS